MVKEGVKNFFNFNFFENKKKIRKKSEKIRKKMKKNENQRKKKAWYLWNTFVYKNVFFCVFFIIFR